MSYEPAANQSGLILCATCKERITKFVYVRVENGFLRDRFCSIACRDAYEGLVYDRWA